MDKRFINHLKFVVFVEKLFPHSGISIANGLRVIAGIKELTSSGKQP
jgi:hypothetical protein